MNTDNKHIDPVSILPKVFSGDASPDEKNIVEDWMKANSANREAYETFARLWKLTGKITVPEIIDIDSEWDRMEKDIKKDIAPALLKPVVSLTRILQIAASVVILSALAFFGFHITGIKSEKAPVFASSTINLPDGTSVTLNAGSKITYKNDYGKNHRNISLKGEAYFEVASNPGQPFIINAQSAFVRVTGTKFNVKAYTNKTDIRVTVLEGTVDLYKAGQPQNATGLNAGETGIFNKTSQKISKEPLRNLNDLSWKTRVIDLHETPFAEVVEILKNTYHYSITIDPVIENCSVTVRFEHLELDSVLDILQSTLDLHITRKGKHIAISGKGC